MDFAPVLEALMPLANGTNSTRHFELPVTVLETFIPGYGLIRKVLLELLGFDVSIFVSIMGFLFLLRTSSTYTWNTIEVLMTQYLTCSINMDEYDESFEPLMIWLFTKRNFKEARQLRPAGRWYRHVMRRAQKHRDSSKAAQQTGASAKGDSKPSRATTPSESSYSSIIYNLLQTNPKSEVGYEPDYGTYRVWHKHRLYFLNIYLKSYQHRHDEMLHLTVSCYGFSAKPIKDLLEEARIAVSNDDSDSTSTTDFWRVKSGENDWRCVSSRPVRPLDTVSLATEQKLRVVNDINNFLNPAASKWYSSRGIPYRRGYLFSGAPGTGKTSLSLALAGVFGLGLYAVSLQDSFMTESRLTGLFDELPEHCIVLLEDIDGAGITSKRAPAVMGPAMNPDNPNGAAGSQNGESNLDQGEGKATKLASDASASYGGLSLAGLLNAIDGVASHEGHILIMTSNHPEKLDEALRRPGRVDLHIEFTLATKFQAREIFLRMYTDEDPEASEKALALGKSKKGFQTVEDVCRERSEASGDLMCPFMSLSALGEAADEFIAAIPDKALSPAQIQGFLLLHKSDPMRAVKEAVSWAEETIKAKAEKTDQAESNWEIKTENCSDDGIKV